MASLSIDKSQVLRYLKLKSRFASISKPFFILHRKSSGRVSFRKKSRIKLELFLFVLFKKTETGTKQIQIETSVVQCSSLIIYVIVYNL